MPLTPGTRLGPYKVTAQIGVGGMGEVYRARDAKLGRDVALKILPEAFVGDPDRVARFEREAQVVAALNHPNIAIIHGFQESDGVSALILELVEGETLHRGHRARAAASATPHHPFWSRDGKEFFYLPGTEPVRGRPRHHAASVLSE